MKQACQSIGQRLPALLAPLLLVIVMVAPLALWALIFDGGGGEPYFMSIWIAMFYIPIAVIVSVAIAWISRADAELRGASLIFSVVACVAVIITVMATRS